MIMQKEQNQKCDNCGHVNKSIESSTYRSSNPVNYVNSEDTVKETKKKYKFKFINRFKDEEGIAIIEIIFILAKIALFVAFIIFFALSRNLIALKLFISIFVANAIEFLLLKKLETEED